MRFQPTLSLLLALLLWSGCRHADPTPPQRINAATQTADKPTEQTTVDTIQTVGLNAQILVCQSVLNNIYQANGATTHPIPRVFLSSDTACMAAFYPRKNAIEVEQKTYAVCRAFGPDSLNALAFVLSHELSHALEAAPENSAFRSSFWAYHRQPGSSVAQEKSADVRGAFMAHLAGYRIVSIVPDLIQKLYAAYPKQGKSAAYPSETERKRTAFEVQGIVDTMIQVFDAANYLLAAGQSDLAVVCYDHLLQTCKSPEIWNNLGLAYTFEAIRLPSKDDYAYPFEVDWQMRLNRPRGQTPTAEQLQQRQLFLLRAKMAFEEALHLSPAYFPAFSNNCCVGLMAENAVEVQQNIKNYAQTKGIQGSESERLALISALAAARMGDAAKAEQLFAPLLESEIPEHRDLARYNLDVLQHGGDQAVQTNSTSNNSVCPSDPMQYKLPSVLTLRRMAGAFEGLGLGKNAELTLTWEKKAGQRLFKARIGADRYCILQVSAVKRGPRLSIKMNKHGINGPDGSRMMVCEDQYLQVFKGGRMSGCGVFYAYRAN